MFKETTAYIDKLTEEKKLPLLDVKVYKSHKEIYRHCTSFTNRFGENDKLCMFSCTKVLTAVCAMKLVEEGKIELDAPVSNYIPEFKHTYTIDENGNKHSEEILVRHLFTMSTGFDYKITRPEILKLSREYYESAGTVDVICTLVKDPLHFSPGERFLYSLSHDALGALLEAVTGSSLAEYARDNVFVPLGMKNSTMFASEHLENPPINHNITENGYEVEKGNTYKHFHPTKNYSSGGAGLISTVDDYAIFADALANGGIGANGYRLIKSETIEKMKEKQFDALNVKNTYTCVQGKDYGYGLGVRVRTVPLECGIPVGEFGWDGAAGSYVLVDTDNGISITMGMNILEWPKVFSGEHLEIAKRIYSEITKS